MAKRSSASPASIDIFNDDRLTSAVAAATAPAATEPSPSELKYPSSAETQPDNRPRIPEKSPEKEGVGQGAQAPSEVAPVTAALPEAPLEPNVPLKFRVPQSMRSDFQTFKAELSAVLGVALDDSNLGRPLIEHVLADQKERILEAAEGFRGRFKRPANGDAVGMAEFDHTLGELFQEARKRRRAPRAN